MSISATKFSSSRRRMPARRLLGFGLLMVVVVGFSWWAMTGHGGTESAPRMTAEDAARAAAVEAVLPEPAPRAPASSFEAQPLPKGMPVVTTPESVPMNSKGESVPASLTMGAKTQTSESTPRWTVERILASNTPGGAPGPVGGGGGGAAPAGTAPSASAPHGTDRGADTSETSPPSSTGAPPGPGSVSASSAVAFLVNQGDSLIAQGKPVEARDVYNRALFDARATESDRVVLRDKLSTLAEALTFSPRVEPGDAMCETYAFQSGDRLVKLPYSKDLAVDWRLIARVNRIADPGRIGLNQRVKLIKGPFHAVVSKSAFRMDVFSNATDSAGNRLYVKSFRVGLGEHGSTPTGAFVVKPKSKLVNPKWVNPRTGEKFAADDPKNPIGERWIGLDGTDATTKLLSGYGIHGTIEPESIGQEKSMGCVRLSDRDVEFIYELLFEGRSTVEIRP